VVQGEKASFAQAQYDLPQHIPPSPPPLPAKGLCHPPHGIRLHLRSKALIFIFGIAAECTGCKTRLGRYYCSICRLWDDQEGRSIYHCPFCNLCRRGQGLGIDACHCMHCNTCMHLSEFKQHTCRHLSACPICTEVLFDSNQPYRVIISKTPPPPYTMKPPLAFPLVNTSSKASKKLSNSKDSTERNLMPPFGLPHLHRDAV